MIKSINPKSPLGDLGVKISQIFFAFLLAGLIGTNTILSQDNESSLANIKIGMLITDSKSVAAVQGAEIAIAEANEKEVPYGRHFQLVVRSMEGPWGTGSKEAVNLIFNEKVWALFGSHDGRNAHLVEQAATRSIVVFVSAWTGDPTLSQAFVPWFFNCVPNDDQQAASLFEEIYNNKKFKKVAVVSDADYESKLLIDSFLKSIEKYHKPYPVQFSYGSYPGEPEALTDDIAKANAECILLICQPAISVKIVQKIRQKKITTPLYGSMIILNENDLSAGELKIYNDLLSIPSTDWPQAKNLIFRQKFQRLYKRQPGLVASYSYDGMCVLIEAIKAAGSNDREKIQRSLENIRFSGITGTIQFDEKGNRSGPFRLVKTRDGVPRYSE